LGELLRDLTGYDIVPGFSIYFLTVRFIFSKGGYAVVAGAAMTASVTQTYSTAIIVMELTGKDPIK
jgi:hypothetical protein